MHFGYVGAVGKQARPHHLLNNFFVFVESTMTIARQIKPNVEIAFSLGGVGGNNGFGAGFLQQAIDSSVVPQIIACTSGQVYWVAEYLSCLRYGQALFSKATSIEQLFRENLDEQTPYGLLLQELKKHFDFAAAGDLSGLTPTMVRLSDVLPFSRDIVSAWFALHGKDERFRLLPAQEWLAEFMANAFNAGGTVAKHALTGTLGSLFLTQECAKTLPARQAQPLFKDEFFKTIGDIFLEEGRRDDGIGIVFNSYNAKQGEECIYANERAQKLLCPDVEKRSQYSKWRRNAKYQDLDHKGHAVRASLWLYQYGFTDRDTLTDGAYFRDVMLGEACAKGIRKIYSVRPISTRWIGDLPKSYIESEDYKTEVGFNGMFAGEMDKMNLIRKVSDDFKKFVEECAHDGLQLPEKIVKYFTDRYPPIEVVSIEPINRNRGYFDYVFEDIALFDEGKMRAKAAF